MKFLNIFLFLFVLENARAAGDSFPSYGRARAASANYERLDADAKHKATQLASEKCFRKAIQISDWSIYRWQNWERVGICSPYSDDCQVWRFSYSVASALFECQEK